MIKKIKQEAKKWKNFMIACIALFIFFVLPLIHDWANNTFINLHFCNHTFCILFSLIFAGFAFFSWKNKKSYIKTALIILVVGIILMNLAVCDAEGNMSIGNFSLGAFSIFPPSDEIIDVCKPGVDCPGDIVLVPVPPCVETDDGRDYITPGMILSGSDVEDMCMGDDILRERYCDSELTYTSEDVSCSDLYGVDWICEDRECILSEEPVVPIIPDDELELCYTVCEDEAIAYCNEHTPGEGTDEYDLCMASLEDDVEDCKTICDGEEISKEDTFILCNDSIDNDGDEAIDCADSDCAEFCECAHDCDPLTGCFGYCDWEIYGYEGYCAIYNTLGANWCECVPNEETPCGDVDGWCRDGDMCVPTPDGSYICVYDYGYPCYESDGGFMPTVGGYCYTIPTGTFEYDFCDEDAMDLMELYCDASGCGGGQGYCESCTEAEGGDYC